MPPPFRIIVQDGKVKGLEESCEKWKKAHNEAMQAFDLAIMVAECLEQAANTERVWNQVWAELNDGVSPDLEVMGRSIDALFSRMIQLTDAIQEDVRLFTTKTGHTIAKADTLGETAQHLKDLHQRIKNNWPWEDLPWPPLNLAMRDRARSGQDGPAEKVEDILKRLQAGGSIS